MNRYIMRVALTALLAVAGLYAGDYLSARYRIPGNRETLGSVEVHVLWAIRQKNGRIEYSLGDTETDTCVRSLFPQLGYTPCWYLRGHTTKRIEVSLVPGNEPAGNPLFRARLVPRPFDSVRFRDRPLAIKARVGAANVRERFPQKALYHPVVEPVRLAA